MPFKSAKRQSGAGMTDSSRSNSSRVSRAGRGANAKRVRSGPRGSSGLELARAFISGISSVLTTSFNVDVTWQDGAALVGFPQTVYAIATVNEGRPSAAQIIAGEDSTGVAAADASNEAATNPTNQIPMTGLTLSTLYFVYTTSLATSASSKEGQTTQVFESQQLTAAV